MRSALVAVALLFAFVLAPRVASADKVYGAYIPDETRKIGEGQYRATRDWDRTVRSLAGVYYRKKTTVWRQMPTAPGVRGVSIQNIAERRRWDWINVYETNGKVFITVLPNPDYVPSKKKSRRRKK
ncbi:MAG: hypothetical protein RMA76_01940 [Deltaproteobacteria bacterium]